MDTKGQNTFDRRKFLVASATGVLVTATVGPKLFAGAIASPPRQLAVGFAQFDEAAAVADATSISSADGGFISRGARISVSGASGTFGDHAERRAVQLTARYSYLDGAERREAPFIAWGCSRETGCQGSPTSFTMPVDETQNISFMVGTERGMTHSRPSRREAFSSGAPEESALGVTLSLHGDGYKLVRGFYVIVPLFDDDAAPRWSQYSLKTSDGRWTLHDGADRPVSFEHIVLRIDYAS
jgi:hypothetical protein